MRLIINNVPVLVVTADTFNCGAECRSLGLPLNECPRVSAHGIAFCANCKFLPANQNYHVCANRTKQTHAEWLDEEIKRLARRSVELAGSRRDDEIERFARRTVEATKIPAE